MKWLQKKKNFFYNKISIELKKKYKNNKQKYFFINSFFYIFIMGERTL
jgi:hypothetical protein